MRFTAKAPASSANLGPGFDAIGLALDLWNELTVEPSDEMSVRLDGSDGEMLIERENLSLTAMRILAHEYHQELPPLALTVRAEVPVSRGLGSSAAAIVVGLLAANEVMGLGLGRRELFATAWRMEGHGDNVGAALYGGAILAAPGVAEAICLTANSSHQLQAVVFIPEMTGATHAARAALPTSIPLVDAAFNVATASSLVAGLPHRESRSDLRRDARSDARTLSSKAFSSSRSGAIGCEGSRRDRREFERCRSLRAGAGLSGADRLRGDAHASGGAGDSRTGPCNHAGDRT